MNQWSVLALALAAAMIAAPAAAQTAGEGKSKTPSAAPSTGATGGDTMKSDRMKSDSMKSDTMKSAGNREQVKSAQEALKQKGFDPGAADGVMGPKTRTALKDFQKKEKLNETGRLDAETMSKLGVQAKADGAGTSPAASPQTEGGPTSGPKAGGEPSDLAKPGAKEPTAPGAPKKQSQ
jgi:peptidoglycan hydrolase-like protein with peptidoglycan-binding domain